MSHLTTRGGVFVMLGSNWYKGSIQLGTRLSKGSRRANLVLLDHFYTLYNGQKVHPKLDGYTSRVSNFWYVCV